LTFKPEKKFRETLLIKQSKMSTNRNESCPNNTDRSGSNQNDTDKLRPNGNNTNKSGSTGTNTDSITDSISVQKLQSTKTYNKRDQSQIIIPPFVNSAYDYSFPDKNKAATASKTLPPKFPLPTKLVKPSIVIDDMSAKSNEVPKPRLRFNVLDFRKKVNIRAVAMAELAFVKIAGKRVTVQPSK
jgi:hypothetical protein